MCAAIFLFTAYCCAFVEPGIDMRLPASSRFVSAHGRYAWAGGYADGGLELWAGALQIASDVHSEFRRAGDVSTIPGAQILSSIDVDPAYLSRIYAGPDFSVEEKVWVPLEQNAIVIRYIVHSVRPLQVIVRFRPSLNLMWPAALGGQEIRWNTEHSGYLFTDSARQFAAVVLAPGATQHDEPLNSTQPLPQTDELAIALDAQAPHVMFARVGPGEGMAGSESLLRAQSGQQESTQHYQDVLNTHLQIETPDQDLNRALAWAVIALDQDWVCNDPLGCGYVGGFGPSRRNRRPQYAWFFAGDGMIAMHGALAEGDLGRAREELQFIAKYQDQQTGMIWHELSQSSPYLDWRGKYPYMFVHADLTYPFISAVAEYEQRSNDRDFLRELWPSVQKAFEYGKSLISSDGLPRIPEGKEGGDEQNPLSDELGLSASWVEACANYAHLASLVGHTEAADEAKGLAQKARASFGQRYWEARSNFPIQAYRRNGQPMQDRGLGAISALPQHLLSDSQADQVLDLIASWQFQSDWGTRGVAAGESGYDPTGYGHGSVWGLATANVAEAYWAAHRPDTAWQVWRTLIPWSTLDSPGHMHEVLAGDTYHPQVESVPEQTWTSASFLSSAIHGLFGIGADQEQGTLTLAPHLPAEWEHARLTGVRFQNSTVDFAFTRTKGEFAVRIENAGESIHLRFNPQLPLGAQVLRASVCGHKAAWSVLQKKSDEHALLDFEVPHGSCDVTITFRHGIELILPAPDVTLGQPSSGMKLTSTRTNANTLELGVDAMSNRENKVTIRTARVIRSAVHAKVARIAEDLYELVINLDTRDANYQHVNVRVNFAE